jgi:hypothetical protein
MEKKYAWKRVLPKDSESSLKKAHTDEKSKTYHWSPYHTQWIIHSPKECKRLKPTKEKRDHKDKKTRRNLATLIITRTLKSHFPAIHLKTAMLLDRKGVRIGDHYHIM